MRVLDKLHRDEFPTVRAEFERAHPPVPHREFAYPGVSADALRELRAADTPIPPTALRAAFDRPAPTWLPAIGLRAVPLASVVRDDITTVLDDIAVTLAAHPDAGNRLLDRPGALDALAEIRQLLIGGAL